MPIDSKSRIYKFDNVKFVSILFVVIGHFVEGYTGKSDMFKSLFVFIYAFHMPLFIYLSGLFQKRFDNNNKLKINKITFYVILGFILKLLSFYTKRLAGQHPKLNFFGGSSIDWFLFVIAMYMITAYLLRKLHPAIVIVGSIVLGSVCGCFNFIDDTLYLSRYFVFLPVYIAGYYMTPDMLMKIASKIYIKIIAYASMLVYFVVCFRNVEAVYKLRKLYTGKNPFSTVPIDGCFVQHRLMCYGISALMCLAVICSIPNIRIPVISRMGSNTLGVYFWHNILLHTLKATPFFALIISTGDPLYKVLLLVVPVVFCFILSLDIFSYPINMLSKLINKLPLKWCYALIAAPFVIGFVVSFNGLLSHWKYLISRITNIIGI